MLCQECKKNNAVYFYSENINGKTSSIALCEECRKKHIEHNKIESTNYFEDILFPSSLIFGPSALSGYEGNKRSEKRCDSCNASLRDLTSGSRNFCPECYNTFHNELSEFFISIHGSDIHKGRKPSSDDSLMNTKSTNSNAEKNTSENENDTTINKLKQELSTAITEERYEDAAKLRDLIKKAEKEKK